ncbi:hypothetical protein H7X87_00230 [Acetobacteraceae bacterium]|nr:hypothetical protein [Candidatus Parcubacteria bacterium]
MNYHKGFAATTALMVVLGIIVLGGAVYVVMNPQVLQKHTDEESIAWHFKDAEEVDAMPHTAVTVVINGTSYDVGTFTGSCNEVGASGGVDGKGLLAGELSAAQCWFAGGGDEIGVFAHEDGGFQIMVGELSEGEEGAGMFRGNFTIKTDISL